MRYRFLVLEQALNELSHNKYLFDNAVQKNDELAIKLSRVIRHEVTDIAIIAEDVQKT